MEEIDRRLLNMIQSEFPIDACPYEVIGERLGIAAGEALKRVRALAEIGIIRRIGPSFDTRKLGHVSALVAAKVPGHRLDEVAEIVSSYPEVTHNYGRDFDYNLWFTLVCRSAEDLDAIVEDIRSQTDIVEMCVLPAERTFKVRVDFEF